MDSCEKSDHLRKIVEKLWSKSGSDTVVKYFPGAVIMRQD